MNIAAILAGGSGKRFGGSIPKQFALLAGKPVIEYSLDAFQQHAQIDEIVLVVPLNYISKCETYRKKYHKLTAVINGGAERYLSTLAVLDYFADKKNEILILHDAARPFIEEATISKLIATMDSYHAATLAIKTVDTIIQSKKHQIISSVLDRSELFNVQTPQAFRFSVLRKAFQLALQNKYFQASDDSSIVFKYLPDEPVAIVEGNPLNIKLTYPHDFYLFEKYFLSHR
jgi:2-C-methyl-D-erythritol 4-phosphate cytidylyltransferase